MTVLRISVATATASLAAKISLCAVRTYNHRLGRRKRLYNRFIKPAPGRHRVKDRIYSYPGRHRVKDRIASLDVIGSKIV